MINPIKQKTVAAAVGSLLIGSVAGISTASAASPFAMTSMESGYMVAEKAKEGKCGEGKCGDQKAMKEGTCGDKAMKDGKEMKDMSGMKGKKEGTCGDKSMKEGKEMKDMSNMKDSKKGKEERKCGEGKCGGSGMYSQLVKSIYDPKGRREVVCPFLF